MNSKNAATDLRAVTKHWLLNMVMEFRHSLRRIFPAVDGQALNVLAVPGAQAEDYAGGLLELFEEGLIQFASKPEDVDLVSFEGVSRLLDECMVFSRENPLPQGDWRAVRDFWKQSRNAPRATFSLTAEGGEAWERVATPNWDLHFLQISDVSSGEIAASGEIASRNLDLLMARLGWFGIYGSGEGEREHIQLDTVRIEKHSEYEVLYWKTQPDVYVATFKIGGEEMGWDPWKYGAEARWLIDWYMGGDKWYRKPWELPDWPTVKS